MTDPKDRFYKVRRTAIRRLRHTGLRVVILKDDIFDIEASDDDTLKKIKICLDRVDENTTRAVARVALPCLCRRQIWVKRPNEANFEIITIKPCQ